MRDNSGAVLQEASSVDRAHSRQLTLNEYANMKNSMESLKSRVSEPQLNKSVNQSGVKEVDKETLDNNGMFSRLKPDSAVQVHGDLYIATRDEEKEGGLFSSRKRSH